MTEDLGDLIIGYLNLVLELIQKDQPNEALLALEKAEKVAYQAEADDIFPYIQVIKGKLIWICESEEDQKIHRFSLKATEDLLSKDPDNKFYQTSLQKNLDAILNLGVLFNEIGHFLQAKNCYELILPILQRIFQTDSKNIVYGSYLGGTLNNLGNSFLAMGRMEEAEQRYEEALEIRIKLLQLDPEDLVYKSDVAMGLNGLGALLSAMGRMDEAKQKYEEALEIYDKLLQLDSENLAYKSYVAMALNGLGGLLYAMGRMDEAKQKYEEALETYDILLQNYPLNIVYQSNKASILSNLGALLAIVGRMEEAIQNFELAFEMRVKLLQINPKNLVYLSDVAMTLNGLAVLLRNLGRMEDAKQRYEIVLKIYNELIQLDSGNLAYKSGIAATLNNLANLLYEMGRKEEAKQRFEEALEIYDKLFQSDQKNLVFQSDVAMTLSNLGAVLSAMDHVEEAKQRFEEALEMREKLLKTDKENVTYQLYVAMTLTNFGDLLHRQGNYSAALDFFLKALEDCALNPANSDLLFKVYMSIGRCYEKIGDYESAFTNYKESIECIESVRSHYSIEEIKMDIMWDKTTPYTEMISLLCTKINDSEKAWEYLGRFKSRTLLDSLRFLDLEAPKNVPEELFAKEKELLKSMRAFDRLIRKTERADELHQLTQEMKRKEAELDEVYNSIRKFSPEYVDLRKGQPLKIKEIKDLIGSQEKKTAFVEYFTTGEKVFIFVMRSDKKVPKVKIVNLTEKILWINVQKYFKEIVIARGRIDETWTELSKYLIDPIFGYIKNCELVYFVPHGLLHYLPLHALFAKNKRLIEYFPIVYAPSLTTLKYSQSKPARKFESCLSMGYTPNENEKGIFEGEAALVAGLFKVEPKLGQEATSRILKNTNDNVIHISCHGGFDWKNSLSSGVYLADKYLQVKEIFDLNFRTNLLVLSACETGLNERKPGDELIGLTRAFLYAGAGSLIVSLWSVRADSTFKFMEKFYSKIKEEKMNKAEALQITQIEFIRDEQYSNTYLWAPFVLIGDWK